MSGAEIDDLFRRIDGQGDALAALTADLVRIPTVNPPGDAYEACARFLGERLATRGFDVEYLRAEGALGDSDQYPRTNVVARIEGDGPGPCVHFNSHIDVVAPGEGWTVDPFAGLVRDGRVYGRGTCDMKGGLAASVIAVEALLESGVSFPGAIEISGTVDEESGGYAGVAWLAERGHFSKPRVDHVIIPEPLYKDAVCLGHRGVWWAEIEVRGRIAHGSMPFLGVSAIRGMAAFLEKVEHELYPQLAQRRTAMPVIPDAARQSTLNFNSIHGGLDEQDMREGFPSALVADRCRVVLDRRYLMEEDEAEVRAEVVEILDRLTAERDEFAYELRELWSVPPTLTAPDSPLVRALDRNIERVLGTPSRHVASPGTYDQKHVWRVGKLKDCVAYGPGILELAHQPDEYIDIDDMAVSAKVMAAAALELLRGSE
ncbi:MAG: acetylornithine deacetylase/succinyl-diaminopimelate desuccinylase family protein [Rhodospirillaceae bacterium]|jgi:succinyl-diaminopimelate desuccinylase|nr:acetylornithine deacetylase/succinyl-diaminopimelate desuccinylase family protein [Rhodospirillaceae bacterium]MBT4771747.1 acetylornithine deacetylase/succinyl-diaminopimelate desuccinylase family protein [Rhodospirillaceae bacterium]MBT5357929.1 acetylornithine deacetylase/succinyl-diaminopimelate desuccinylase family protein [Rhodospirillaceae bacterium]MBT5768622.1 acetylornithine deacetylase/succinyl-diaminopimelate desuccinylase family protein [Rhodospirillaceae bacterium]MBT6308249.1 